MARKKGLCHILAHASGQMLSIHLIGADNDVIDASDTG